MMFGQEISLQVQLFARAIFVGAGMFLFYDLMRAFRRAVPHGTVGIAVEDILFWLTDAVLLFGLMYREADGNVRGFVLIGAVLGIICYRILLSAAVLHGASAIFLFLRKIICNLYKSGKKALKKIRKNDKIKKGD